MGIVKDIDGAAYMSGHNASGIKAGDRVKVTQEASTLKGRWGNTSGIEMDSLIGKTFLVTSDGKDFGFRLDHVLVLFLPYFVLEKVEEPSVASQYEELRSLIDGGSESMKHDEAVKELKRLIEVDDSLAEEKSNVAPAKQPFATVSRLANTITIECGKETTTGEVDWLVSKVEEVVAEVEAEIPAEETPPRAKVGDWVRRISPPSKPAKVASVGTCGVVAGNASDDDARIVTGFGYADHGNYEIVRQVVTPWAMKDACEALAKHDMTLVWGDSLYRVSDIDTIGVQFTPIIPFVLNPPFLKTYKDLADQSSCCMERFEIGGQPCGNVTWEVV